MKKRILANWPNNELIGDKVIIPPASDEKTARERLEKAKTGEMECFDWWFCFSLYDVGDIMETKKNLRLRR